MKPVPTDKTARELLEESVTMFSTPVLRTKDGEIVRTMWTAGHEYSNDYYRLDESGMTEEDFRSLVPIDSSFTTFYEPSSGEYDEDTPNWQMKRTMCSVGAISLASLTNDLRSVDPETYTGFVKQATMNFEVAKAGLAVVQVILRMARLHKGVYAGRTWGTSTAEELCARNTHLGELSLATVTPKQLDANCISAINTIIIHFNDDMAKTWTDVIGVFNEAIKNLIAVEGP